MKSREIWVCLCVFQRNSQFPTPVLCSLQLEVKMQVEYMSFSAHADAKGIMQLIRQAEPRNVLLVHGEAKKMEFLKQKIEQEFRGYPWERREWHQSFEISFFLIRCPSAQSGVVAFTAPLKELMPATS